MARHVFLGASSSCARSSIGGCEGDDVRRGGPVAGAAVVCARPCACGVVLRQRRGPRCGARLCSRKGAKHARCDLPRRRLRRSSSARRSRRFAPSWAQPFGTSILPRAPTHPHTKPCCGVARNRRSASCSKSGTPPPSSWWSTPTASSTTRRSAPSPRQHRSASRGLSRGGRVARVLARRLLSAGVPCDSGPRVWPHLSRSVRGLLAATARRSEATSPPS